MNSLKEIVDNYNLKIKSLKYVGKVIIIETEKETLVYKNDSNNYAIYDYLKSHDFNYFPKIINNKNAKYEITNYIKEQDINNYEKINNLVYLTSVLHQKTSFFKEIDLDELKKMYENILNEANYLMNYYHDINNYIDNNMFMSPTEYLLISNIDLFYFLLSFIIDKITVWYNYVKENKIIRYAMVHGNLSLNHILTNDNIYLISWDKAHLDMPVVDLKKIYEDNFEYIDLDNLLNQYNKLNKLDNYEYLFLLINFSLPKRIEFTDNTYLDSYNLGKYLTYLRKNAITVQKYLKNKQNV